MALTGTLAYSSYRETGILTRTKIFTFLEFMSSRAVSQQMWLDPVVSFAMLTLLASSSYMQS